MFVMTRNIAEEREKEEEFINNLTAYETLKYSASIYSHLL